MEAYGGQPDSLVGVVGIFAEILKNQSPSNEACATPVVNFQTTIREFQGNEGPDRAKAWIHELENVKQMNGWSDVVALSVARARLQGGAFKWLLTKGNLVDTFENFVSVFKSTFTYTVSISDKLKAMTSQVQKQNETIHDYFLDKVFLCQGLEFSVIDI